MGLNRALARAAADHAHLLLVEVPGHWPTRAAAERAALRRGWRLAVSPADADILAVCGAPGPLLRQAIDLVWDCMPEPRVRVSLEQPADAGAALDRAHAGLLDTLPGSRDTADRPSPATLLERHRAPDSSEHGDHEDHEDHGDMEMAPDGIPLAEGGEDRDGLEMDVLQVQLGPVLPHWPAGLVLRCALQGDVITKAHGEILDGQPDAGPDSGPARRCDAIAALLDLAGWEWASAEARQVRDALLTSSGDAVGRFWRLQRRVSRSRVLRWSLRGLGRLSAEEAVQRDLPHWAAGDCHDRLLGMLERTWAELTRQEGDNRSGEHRDGSWTVAGLAEVVTGLDLAAARLVIASLDVSELRGRTVEHRAAHHG